MGKMVWKIYTDNFSITYNYENVIAEEYSMKSIGEHFKSMIINNEKFTIVEIILLIDSFIIGEQVFVMVVF